MTVVLLGLTLLASACGDDATEAMGGDRTASTDDELESDPDATSLGAEDAEWCETWSRLRGAEAPSPEDFGAAARTAPESIRGHVESLAADDLRVIEPRADPEAAVVFLRDVLAVESWAYQHCGTEHPFCAAWPSFTSSIGLSALSGEPETPELLATFAALGALAMEHAPAELDHLEAIIEESVSGAVLEGERERAAEAAYDTYDAWEDDHCGP